MSTYSVADAKNGLPRLIDLALEGEEVVITRHGRPVAELRAIRPSAPAGEVDYSWLTARRLKPEPGAPSAVELLREMYEGDGAA